MASVVRDLERIVFVVASVVMYLEMIIFVVASVVREDSIRCGLSGYSYFLIDVTRRQSRRGSERVNGTDAQ